MTTTYRYLFADLLTNDILGELPLTGVSFNQQLNQAGTLSSWLVVYVITGKGSLATLIAFWETVVKVVIYYYHERAWNQIRWGRIT